MNWREVLFFVGLAGVLFGLAWRGFIKLQARNARFRGRNSIVTKPPSGLTPAEIGVLLSSELTKHELVATMMDLVARQKLALHADGKLVARMINLTGLKGFERVLIVSLFSKGLRERSLSDLDSQQITKLQLDMQNTIRAELVEEDEFAQPPRVKRIGPILLGFIVICVIIIAIYGLNLILPGASSVAIAVFGLAAGWWLFRSSRLSQKGMDDLGKIEGFRNYLANINQPADSKLYTSYLGYAYILGVEKEWSRKCGKQLNKKLIQQLERIFESGQ